jgi:hypothetical protein
VKPFAALSIVFGMLGRLRFWPGDRVRVYGLPATYVRLVYGSFHIIDVKGTLQLAPPESLRARGDAARP